MPPDATIRSPNSQPDASVMGGVVKGALVEHRGLSARADAGIARSEQGRPIRVFYAFDPRRAAILLIGGEKTGDKRFYAKMIPIADKLYDDHLDELRNEGLIP